MSIKRTLTKVYSPPEHPGFLGNGHNARAVVQIPFEESDPFIVLMDDMLDKKDEEPAGGPHPHAGVEIGSLLLEGEMGDAPHRLKAGDFEIMMAGSGIIHTETIAKKTQMRLLQLWLNPPKKDRQAKPRLQRLPAEHVPTVSEKGVHIRVYSGSLAGVTSPIQNYTPLILAEVKMKPGSTTVQHLPANFKAFLYAIDGSLSVGEDEKPLNNDQVGWLDILSTSAQSELKLKAGDEGTRFVLYAAKPQNHNIVVQGPFVANTSEDIKRLYADYRAGKMKHISTVPEEQRILW